MTPRVSPALRTFLRRREEYFRECAQAEKKVSAVIRAVKKDGDRALIRFTRMWDRAKLKNVAVSPREFSDARRQVRADARTVIEAVVSRFNRFYETQKSRAIAFVDDTGTYSERIAPLDRAGLYVPGGRAPLVSTLLMLAVPAGVAGVRERYVATPPRPDGTVPPLILAAAEICGVTRVFKMGGAQAVAAFAYGTKTVPKVDKIFGPGNRFVTAAKKMVFGDVGIDMLAGPSELIIIADETADTPCVIEDLMAQAEHGPDSLSLLVTTSAGLAAAVKNALGKTSMAKQVFTVVTKTLGECAAISNDVAPEHLTLAVASPESLLSSIGAAGAIFLGTTAVAYGDYVAGPNHTLPTSGTARFSSPLSVEAFLRRSSVLRVRDTRGTLACMGMSLAEWEGLEHHKRSLALRAKRA